MPYQAHPDRYNGTMPYRQCGKSGLKLPAISLGLWHNFGDATPFQTQRDMLRTAFDFGADAIYAGQPRYSLRVRNNDFGKMETLKEGIDTAHALGNGV